MTDLRVGVVGMGIGQLHLLSWTEVVGASAVILAETDPARREQAGRDWKLDAVGTLDEVLAAGVDVVDLCTPPAAHEAQILKCLDAGVHVICEKPLVDSLAACDRLAAAADRAASTSGARLMPILQYRFGPGSDVCTGAHRRRTDRTPLHRLRIDVVATRFSYYAEAVWRSTWQGALGGTVVNHAVHIHDLLTWIGGPLADLHTLRRDSGQRRRDRGLRRRSGQNRRRRPGDDERDHGRRGRVVAPDLVLRARHDRVVHRAVPPGPWTMALRLP